jgi:hypothetical protein
LRQAMSSARARWATKASAAWAVIETLRTPAVLVVLTVTPRLVAETERSMRMLRPATSMSSQQRPQTSPRRAPVATATWSQHAIAGLVSWAFANSMRTTAGSGGRMTLRGTSGRLASLTTLRASQPQRTACATARCNTTCAHRMREGPRPSALSAV